MCVTKHMMIVCNTQTVVCHIEISDRFCAVHEYCMNHQTRCCYITHIILKNLTEDVFRLMAWRGRNLNHIVTKICDVFLQFNVICADLWNAERVNLRAVLGFGLDIAHEWMKHKLLLNEKGWESTMKQLEMKHRTSNKPVSQKWFNR